MPSTPQNDLNSRVRSVIGNVFRLPEEEANGDLRLGSPPQWDSIGHMQLLVEIENEFALRFPTHAIANLTTVDTIVEAIRAHNEMQ